MKTFLKNLTYKSQKWDKNVLKKRLLAVADIVAEWGQNDAL